MSTLGVKAKPRRTLQMNSFFRVKQWIETDASFYLNDGTLALLLGSAEGDMEEALEEQIAQPESEYSATDTPNMPYQRDTKKLLLPPGSKPR